MNPPRATLLLPPSILALAWLIAWSTTHAFALTAILLAGGALVAGFVQAMQGLWSKGGEAGQSAIRVVTGVVFRLAIGLFVIACMVYAAMWATGVL